MSYLYAFCKPLNFPDEGCTCQTALQIFVEPLEKLSKETFDGLKSVAEEVAHFTGVKEAQMTPRSH